MGSVENESFYKILDPILDDINKEYVKINDELRKEYVQLAYDVVNYVVVQLKEKDFVFNYLYSRLEYVGSFFDGLRVKEPTEFDLNLIMKMSLDYNKILVENNNVDSGFVKINISEAMKNNQQPEIVTKAINQWCDSKGYLLENKVRGWMEGVIARSLGAGNIQIPTSSGMVKVIFKKAGPAFTLSITTEKKITIDVDLVFTIEFPETKKPPTSIRWVDGSAAPWVVVPKPSSNNQFWRISFSKSEKMIIHQKYKLKFINRLLKAVRDAQINIKAIPSYHIKTLFLWEAHECIHKNKDRFWEKPQGFLFVYMLNKLWEALNEENLRYYWHSKMNMFNRFSTSHMVNMANRIKHIIAKINEFIRLRNIVQLRMFMFDLFEKSLTQKSSPQDSINDNASYCSII